MIPFLEPITIIRAALERWRRKIRNSFVLLAGCTGLIILGLSIPVSAAEINPLRPVDTSSPRATLQGFAETVDQAYVGLAQNLNSYAPSGRLYLSSEERQRQVTMLLAGLKAVQFLDRAKIPPALKDTVAAERMIQLKEILDRIELPPFDEIPDRDSMTKSSEKRWRIPNTEIDIALIEDGPHIGEYLFSADTINRIPEFYERVRDLPYKPGPAKQLADAYRAISSNRASTIYDAFSTSPVGLSYVIPPRWMLALPPWAKSRVANVAVWQWFGFTFGLFVAAMVVFGAYRLGHWLERGRDPDAGPGLPSLLTPATIVVVAALYVPLLSVILRISGTPHVVAEFCRTVVLFLSAAWLVFVGAGVFGGVMTASEHLNLRSLDSQLIKLGARFIGIAVAILLLMQAATELGFPAYSVLAGLGVGGLAVALAARDSLANFLGSVLIMFEKPFRIGHRIRVAGSEGVVEDVGFRSTRLRTADSSLISIPNNAVVNATVENLSLRRMFRQRLLVQVTYDTPRAKLEILSLRIKQLIDDHPMTSKDNIYVNLNDFGESSLNILVIFFLMVPNYAAELEERERILLQIMEAAEELGVEFAFPTRTLHVETMPAMARSAALDVR
jgi:MscS family membrane protein